MMKVNRISQCDMINHQQVSHTSINLVYDVSGGKLWMILMMKLNHISHFDVSFFTQIT